MSTSTLDFTGCAPEAVLALTRALKSEASDLDVQPGKYEIEAEFLVRLKGSLLRSEDTTYQPTQKIPWLTVLALTLEKSGISRELSKRILIESIQEALRPGADESLKTKLEARISDLEASERRVRGILKALPREARKGPCRASVSVDVNQVVEIPRVVPTSEPDVVTFRRITAS
jgi:hypothetical protein